jgi:DNA invertase Pin-like site-specific DNA recombinase
MKKAYSYIRFSGIQQAEGDSLRRQTELSEKYADKHGLNLVSDFKDLGISAFKGKNLENGLGQFIEAVRQGKIEKGSVLLVENLDRLSRQEPVEALIQLQELLKLGIEVVTLQDEQVFKDGSMKDAGKLFTSIAIMLRANEESEAKSKRLKAMWENKRKHAGTKIITSICPNWLVLASDRKSFEVKEDAEIAIKTIFDMALKGYGSYKIVNYLNKNVKPISKSNGKWYESYVRSVLRNDAVIGNYRPATAKGNRRIKTGEVIVGYYPEIIDKETFQRVQDMMDGRKGGRKGLKYSNVFAGGMLKCGFCNDTVGMFNIGKGIVGLKCKNTRIGFICCNSIYNYHEFETDFFSFIKAVDVNEILDIDKGSEDLQALEALQNREQALSRKLEKALQTLNNPEIDEISISLMKALDKQIRVLEEEITLVKSEIKNIQTEMELKQDDVIINNRNDVVNLSTLLQGKTDVESYEIRQSINNKLKTLISRIIIYSGFKFPAEEIYNNEADISSEFIEFMIRKGYANTDQQYQYLKTVGGQRIYNRFERYFVVRFRNHKTITVRPMKNMVWLQDDERLYQLLNR